MNKLKGLRCYLAGNMDYVDDGGTKWRDDVTPILEDMGVNVLSPCAKEKFLDPASAAIETSTNREYRKRLKEAGEYERLASEGKPIRTTDLRCVDVVDFIVLVIDLDKRPCGTWEEFFTANRQKKPVIFITKQGKPETPDWVFLTIPHQMIFSTLEDGIDYLKKVDSGEDGRDFGRWVFFQFNKE